MTTNKTEPGPDGYLWQLWDHSDIKEIHLQRRCEAEGCDKGLVYAPVRDCGKCRGSGFIVRKLTLA